MGAMRALRAPGGGWSRMATCGRDRSSFNTEPGLRSGRFLQKRERFSFGGRALSFLGQGIGFCGGRTGRVPGKKRGQSSGLRKKTNPQNPPGQPYPLRQKSLQAISAAF